MRIAIALCTHGGERFLREQLDSIADQSRLPDEVVIGDDVSVDSTAAIVERFAADVPFRVVFLPAAERLGTAKNFERVIAACHAGDADGVIVMADQDDVWHRDRLAETELAFTGPSRPGLVFSDGLLINERSEPLGSTLWSLVRLSSDEIQRMEGGASFLTLLQRQLTLGGTITGATMAFRAEHRSRVLPFPDWLPRWGKAAVIHDAWIALVVAATAPVLAIPRPLVLYRVHGAQQVGLLPRPPVSRARMAGVALRSLRAPDGEKPRLKELEVEWLETLSERLRTARTSTGGGAEAANAEALGVLDALIAHFSVRATLPLPRLRRVRPIVSELVSGRYGAYSNGPLSAVRDLLQQP